MVGMVVTIGMVVIVTIFLYWIKMDDAARASPYSFLSFHLMQSSSRMIKLSVIMDLGAIFGVIPGFTYYVLTVRNAQESRQREQVYLRFQSFDMPYMRAWVDVMDKDWTNPEE